MENPFISNYLANMEALAINNNSALGLSKLTVYSGIQPLNANTSISGCIPLIDFNLPDASSNVVTASGTIIFGLISPSVAYASGNASFFRITNGVNTILDGNVGTTDTDMILPTVTIGSGIIMNINSYVYTITK